jgi:diguanylate cyclase (GGDEF)-like protein
MINGKRKTIGVFSCKAYSLFDRALFKTLEEQAHLLNYDIIIFSTVGYFASQNDYDTQEKRMFSFAPLEQLDGILMAPDTYEIEGFRDALLEEIRQRATCPVVAIRHLSDEYDCSFTDENNTIRPLIRHLLEDHGCTRVRFLAGYEGHPDSERRLQTFREEMAGHGLQVDEEQDIFHGNMWYNCGPDAYQFFFQDREKMPEAVICANDYMAVGLMRVLMQNGIRIPKDVIVTGFDNVENLALECPTLTTVEQDFSGMVRAAFAQLDRRIREEEPETGLCKMPIPGILVKGESCGCGAAGENRFAEISMKKSAALDAMNAREVGMTYFTIEMSACDNLKELHQTLVKKQPDTPMLRDFYLCLFEERKNRNGEPEFGERVTDTACLVHAMKDQQDCGMPMISFDRSQLLPLMADRETEAQVFHLTLLHQKEFNYGYAMFHYIDGEIPSTFFQHWSVTLSGALRNLYNQGELRRLYEERRRSSVMDVLTGLNNRRGMEETVHPMWDQLCRRRANVALISFDLDYLKTINDTFGHQAGDFAIRLVASAIRESMPEKAVTARMGGDEFLAFVPDISEREAKKLPEMFEKRMEEKNQKENRSFRVQASCGCWTACLDANMTFEDCMQASDQVMYRVKAERHVQR